MKHVLLGWDVPQPPMELYHEVAQVGVLLLMAQVKEEEGVDVGESGKINETQRFGVEVVQSILQ